DDAEAAEFVAPLDDRHVRLHGVVADGHPERPRDVILRAEVDQARDAALAGAVTRPLDEHRKAPDRLGADNDVRNTPSRPLPDGLAFLLGHAAGDGDDRVVAL